MPAFGITSKEHLATLHPDLQKVLTEAIKYYDFTIVCGFRNEQDQNDAVKRGASTTPWPKSKHNTHPAIAVDIVPYPGGYNNPKEQILLAGFIIGIATVMGIKLRWGGDWDSDKDMDDEKGLIDYPHFELLP